jgi:SLT domain-containing protein
MFNQSPDLATTTLRRLNQESGGNPTIVNRTDSNWQAGHPSVGLMQVIEGTFKRFAGPFKNRGPFEYGVSVDPMANIYASMHYALSTYGSLHKAYDRAGGYDDGGYLPTGDFGGVFNHSGKPEPVFSASQWDILKANIGTGGGANVLADVRVFVGSREITDIVRTEITTYDANEARGLDTGRRL